MKYTVNFFIRSLNDELVNFGQEEVNQFVDVVNEHIESKCGFILQPNQNLKVKSASFDKSDGSITLTITSNINDKYLVSSVLDVIPFCPPSHNKVLSIFQGSAGQKITYDSDIPAK